MSIGQPPTSLTSALMAAAGRIVGDSARADAEILLAAVLGKSRSWLYAYSDARLDDEHARQFAELVARRARGEPVAHLVGRQDFWSMELLVTADTLIPRPETELLVELALECTRNHGRCRILDLGTGSGAIALAVAAARPGAIVTAVDADNRALAVAKRNAAKHGLVEVRFLQGDWFSPVVGEAFELILSNPPYLSGDDPHLSQGDLRYEPRAALVSGIDGLDAIRTIAHAAPSHLVRGGMLLLEHGWDQGAAVRRVLSDAGLASVETRVDLEGRERVTLGAAQ